MIENPFDTPIPGQSLTDIPGNGPWEHPPQFTNIDDASEYVWKRIHNEKQLGQIITFLNNGIPVEAIARMILFSGFMDGKWTPDVALLLAKVVFKQIMAIGMKAEIPNIKLFLRDQSNTKFHKQFAKFKSMKENGASIDKAENKAEKFAEEVKKELEEMPGGLMAKETE